MSEIRQFFSAKPDTLLLSADEREKSKYIMKFFSKRNQALGYDSMRNNLIKIPIVRDLYFAYFDYTLNKINRKEDVKVARGHKKTPPEELLEEFKSKVIGKRLDFNFFEEWADTIILNPDKYSKKEIDEIIRVDTKQKFRRSIFDITTGRTEKLYKIWNSQLKEDKSEIRKPIIEQLEEKDIINVDIFKNLLKQGQLDIKDIPTTLEPEIEEIEEEEEIEPLVIPNKLVQQIEGYTGKQKGLKRSEELQFTEADQLRLDTIKDRVVKKVLEFKKEVADRDVLVLPTNKEDILDRLNKLIDERKAKKTNAKYKKNFEERVFEYIKLWIDEGNEIEEKNEPIQKISKEGYKVGYLKNENIIALIKSEGESQYRERQKTMEIGSAFPIPRYMKFSTDYKYEGQYIVNLTNRLLTNGEVNVIKKFKNPRDNIKFIPFDNPEVYKVLTTDEYEDRDVEDFKDNVEVNFDTIEKVGGYDNYYYDKIGEDENTKNYWEYFYPFIRMELKDKKLRNTKTALFQYYMVNPNRFGFKIEEVLINIPVIRVDKKSTDNPNNFKYEFKVWGYIYIESSYGSFPNEEQVDRIRYFGKSIAQRLSRERYNRDTEGYEFTYEFPLYKIETHNLPENSFMGAIDEDGNDVVEYPNFLVIMLNKYDDEFRVEMWDRRSGGGSEVLPANFGLELYNVAKSYINPRNDEMKVEGWSHYKYFRAKNQQFEYVEFADVPIPNYVLLNEKGQVANMFGYAKNYFNQKGTNYLSLSKLEIE
jgi:hypothetical protein